MTITKFKKSIIFQTLVLICLITLSCNSKKEETEEVVVTSANVAVKNFYLNANSKVLSNLDSVFFSIDLDNGVIFNADSLPKGTNVSRLLATITFANSMTKAELTFKKDNANDTTINYLTNSNDSIDFTYPVKLDVTAADGTSSFSYLLKVNVHRIDPDTLIWDKLAVSLLPSRMENPVAQNSLIKDGTIYSLIEEFDGSYTLSTSDDLNQGSWEKTQIEFGFMPDLESFTASESDFWILSESGDLYTSENAADWLNTGKNWISIVGGYADGVLGIRENESGLVHTSFPEYLQGNESVLEDNFPLKGRSQLAILDTTWSPLPTAFFTGGITASGNLSTDVWAFDGNSWDTINSGYLPALNEPMLAHYVVYRKAPGAFRYREFDAWLLFGGNNEDGNFNSTMYISLDNGVIWSEASEMMQLPEDFPRLSGADVIVAEYDLAANLSDAWSSIPSKKPGRWCKPSYTLDGYEISWECPYMFVFGGYLEDGTLSETIYRGVLARLTNTPLI